MERVKKLFRIIVCGLAVLCFIGCKWAYSKPVSPKIIGTTHIQSEKGLVFVEIDSVRYAANEVFTGKRDSRTGEDITMDAVDGMLVTAFKANNSGKVRFVAGTKTAVEIEAMFHRNGIFLFVFGFMLVGFIVFAVLCLKPVKNKEEIPIALADADD